MPNVLHLHCNPAADEALRRYICVTFVKCPALSEPQSSSYLNWEHYDLPLPCGPRPLSETKVNYVQIYLKI